MNLAAIATSTVTDTTTVTARSHVGLVAGEPERGRLAAALGRRPFKLAAVAGTVDELLDVSRETLDLVVLAGGEELLARGGPVELARNLRPSCPLVLVTPGDQAVVVRKALRAGVAGYVPAESADAALQATIAAVLAGQLSVPRSIRTRATWSVFSTREKQVLQYVAAGLTNRDIADRLYLSESTVKSHLSSSFRKLGVSSRAEAAAVVLDTEGGLGARIGLASVDPAGPPAGGAAGS